MIPMTVCTPIFSILYFCCITTNHRLWAELHCSLCNGTTFYYYGIRLWQVVSPGYALSISLVIFRLKYQSPTASAMVLLWTLGESIAYHVSCDSLWQWAKHEFMNIPPLFEYLKNKLKAASISCLKPCRICIWFVLQAAGLSLQRFQCPCISAEGGTSIWWNCWQIRFYSSLTSASQNTINVCHGIYNKEGSKNFTWYTSYAEFKIKNGVVMYLNAYWGKKHCFG